KGTSAHAIAAADTVLLLKIDDAVAVLHNGAIGRTGRQAPRISAVHALVFAHEQHQRTVFALVLVELDQVPVIPRRLGHGLVAVVEGGVAEGVAVPLEAGNLASLAANAGCRINQLAYLLGPLYSLAGHRPCVAGYPDDFKCRLAHSCAYTFSSLTRKPLYSGVCALGSFTVGESRFTTVLGTLSSSS